MRALRERLRKALVQAAIPRMTAGEKRAVGLAGNEVECPCCGGKFLCFLPTGVPERRRPHALCPNCASRERHRLMWLFLQRRTRLMQEPLELLHVAPERFFFEQFSKHPMVKYTAGDMFTPGYTYPQGTIDMDLTRMAFPDASFDAIICSHVLEHIPDDRQAMREMRRVLRPGAFAIIQVPMNYHAEHTEEDLSITDPKERLRLYGQEDHVRMYGRDLQDRLEQAGFTVEAVPYFSTFSRQERFRFGLPADEFIYHCTA